MKKNLLSQQLLQILTGFFILLFLTFQGKSQNLLTTNGDIPAEFERGHSTPSVTLDDVTEWFNYGEDIYLIAQDQGGDVSYFRTFLFPDSTVLVEFTSGLGAPWKHSQGQVFDPVSPFFSVLSPEVSQYTPYTLDSIGFYYRYFRFQDSAPDTLIIQVYEDDNIGFEPNPGWTSGASYATVNYDYTARIGANPSAQYTYLLTNDDTISTTQGYLRFPVNIPVAAGKKVAATITYIPGNTFNTGDTIDVYVVPPPVNQRNAFITYEYRDNDFNVEAGYYNNQLTASTEIRYNTSTNGWNGTYIPGTAWNAGFYHLDMGFLITFNPTGIDENAKRRINLFPNPAGDEINLDITAFENEKINISVVDVSGREVYSINESYFSSMDKHIMINTKSLNPGIYFCRISGNKFSENLKFVKE